MRQVRLAGFALGIFVLVPLAILGVLSVIALGFVSSAGLAVGLFSLVGWWLLDNPDAGWTAAYALAAGGAAFILLTLIWDRVFAMVSRLQGGGDAKFLG